MIADAAGEQEVANIEELLRALNYDFGDLSSSANDLEDYILGYLDEDLGMNLFVNLDGGEIHLVARMSFYTDDAVNMWSLPFPTTLDKFRNYLNELDVRVARLRAIVDLPTPHDLADRDVSEPSIVETLARLFQTTEPELVDELGADWTPIDSDEVGLASTPVRYLVWAGQVVVGLDDEHLHLLRLESPQREPSVGEVADYFELGVAGARTMSLADLSAILRISAERY